MKGAALIIDAFGRNKENLHAEFADISVAELSAEPHPSIGWLAWHLIRVLDSQISQVAEIPQAWISDGWHEKFAMPPEPRDYGPAHTHTPAQTASLAADAATLLAYHDAVYLRSVEYLNGLSDTDFDRVLDDPRYDPRPTVGVRLVSVVDDNMQHMGQIIFQKACLRAGGWFPNPAA